MITKDNFKEALISLGFKETGSGVLVKNYHNLQTFQMKADLNTERLEYAQGITADRDTTIRTMKENDIKKVLLLGSDALVQAIMDTEDRELFVDRLNEIDVKTIKSEACETAA